MRPVSRRLALVLVVVLAVPALALAADTDPKKRINPADQRKAASIVLKRADFVAGWKKGESWPSSDERLQLPRLQPRPVRPRAHRRGQTDRSTGRRDPVGLLGCERLQDAARGDARVGTERQARARAVPRAAVQDELAKSGGKMAITRRGAGRLPKVAPRQPSIRVGLDG